MSHPQDTLHLAVALEGTGWHPASWREPGARADELLSAGFWLDQVREAEAGLADLVTFEDSFRVQDDRPDHLQGRLDPTLIAQRLGPVTRHVGLVPTVVATHTEPFHVSTQIATLDYVSEGRAGERVRVSGDPAEAALFGRRDVAAEDRDGLFDEAADHVEVQRRLWDSWEDDAEIRDATTGRFIDRDKLHYVDFVGSHFAVRGPSITPRPPQGQPLVTVLAHVDLAYRLAARAADVVFTTPDGAGMDGPCGTAEEVVAAVRAAESAVGREGEPLRVLGDVLVFLDDSADEARRRRDRLDATWASGATGRDTAGDGRGITVGADGRARKGDAKSVTGTAADVADVLEAWAAAGVVGARLRPAVTTHDLPRITRELVPELQRRGLFRTSYAADTLRGHFGLGHPADRYAASHQSV